VTKKIDRGLGIAMAAALAMLCAIDGVYAAEENEEEKPAWTNSTDLSMVVTDGNTEAETWGFKNTLRRNWKRARFQLKLDSVKSGTADDRFVVIEPGLEWFPGEEIPAGATSVVTPGLDPDVERYFAEGRYDRDITKRLLWHLGGSWDRNEDAGILNRYIGFGGLGHVWRKDEDFRFATSYGVSYTDREEDEPDPEKDDQFFGLRLSWDYMNKFGKVAVYENDFTANMSQKDTSDYSLNMVNALSVNVSDHLAMKVSLQWQYENEPALEDVDVVAYVELVDPDGEPATGDEFFRTVSSGGFELTIGEEDIRKDELDTIFRTSLVINF
jgi:hypothetical protein